MESRCQNKTIKTTSIPRSARVNVEIQKHFDIDKRKSSEINPGVESFPIVGDIQEFNYTRIPSEKLTIPKNASHDLDALSTSDCSTLNRRVEEINQQLADLENDIQKNFYDPKTLIGSFVQNPTNTPTILSQISINANRNIPQISNPPIENVFPKQKPPSIQFEIGIKKTKSRTEIDIDDKPKTPKSARKVDPSAEIKNEIMQYRQTIKNKVMEERMERKLESLRNEKLQPVNEPFQPPANIAETIRKIRENQMLTSAR